MAADHDPALVALKERLATQRLEGMTRFARLLEARGVLRAGLTADRAADLLWTICAQSNFETLVAARGWDAEDYAQWLGDILINCLLPAAEPSQPGRD